MSTHNSWRYAGALITDGLPVFGGCHPDVQIHPEMGRLIADLIVQRNLSCIVDTSSFTQAGRCRFLRDFADHLRRLQEAGRFSHRIILNGVEWFFSHGSDDDRDASNSDHRMILISSGDQVMTPIDLEFARAAVKSEVARRSPRWTLMQRLDIRKLDRRYIDRLRVIQTPWFSVLFHRIHTPDLDRDPHSHPWPFISIVLSGSYAEEVWDQPALIPGTATLARIRVHARWSIRVMRLSQAHRIIEIEGMLKTLVITGRRRPSWHFWTTSGPVDWTEYIQADDEAAPA